MESSIEQRKPNFYILFAGIVVCLLLVLGYVAFFRTSSIPRPFFSKYAEQDTLVKQTLPVMQFHYGMLSQHIQSKNASGAAMVAKDYLIQSLKNKENEKSISTKTTELKVLLSSVSDSTLREKLIKLFGLLDERNQKMRTVVDTQVTIFTALRNHFGAIAVGGKGPEMPQNIDSVIEGSQKELQSILQLQTSLEIAYAEIVKLAGTELDTTNASTAERIRMSLSATPIQSDPFITDFPTPTQGPTAAPTVNPASSSAELATESAE